MGFNSGFKGLIWCLHLDTSFVKSAHKLYQYSLWAGRSGDRIPMGGGGGEIFCTCPNRPWGPPSLLYNEYRVSFTGVKQPGRGDHPRPSSTEVKERVELYLYSPSRPSWLVLEWTLPLLPEDVDLRAETCTSAGPYCEQSGVNIYIELIRFLRKTV